MATVDNAGGKIELHRLTFDDFEQVADIYNYYVLHSTATFHTQPLLADELRRNIAVGHPKYPSFLIHDHNLVCGFCYIGQYKAKQAYDRTAEITIYLKPDFSGMGIGKQVVLQLEDIALKNGIKVLIGVISGNNQASISLFERCDYVKCAHFKQIGEKFNQVIDVVAYQKILD